MALDRRRIYRKRHRLKQLRAFCHAARLGSFSRAAECLGLSGPAVALQVRELEYELEAVLFERGAGGVRLTAAGEAFHALAAPLVDGVDGLLEGFAGRFVDEVTGRVDLAASVAGAAVVLPPYVRRFRERYPAVRLRVRSRLLGEGLGLLRAGEVELVLGAREPLVDPALEYREMRTYDIVLITALGHPLAGRATVTREEVAEWPAIVPPAGTYSRQSGETAARELGLDTRAVVEVGGWGVIKRYVERGFGISVVPSLCLHPSDQVSVVPLSEHFAARSFGVYTRRGQALSAPARRLLEVLVPGCAQSGGRGSASILPARPLR